VPRRRYTDQPEHELMGRFVFVRPVGYEKSFQLQDTKSDWQAAVDYDDVDRDEVLRITQDIVETLNEEWGD
jgi:hypothetical protein